MPLPGGAGEVAGGALEGLGLRVAEQGHELQAVGGLGETAAQDGLVQRAGTRRRRVLVRGVGLRGQLR